MDIITWANENVAMGKNESYEAQKLTREISKHL